jgi:hypothetical protein
MYNFLLPTETVIVAHPVFSLTNRTQMPFLGAIILTLMISQITNRHTDKLFHENVFIAQKHLNCLIHFR